MAITKVGTEGLAYTARPSVEQGHKATVTHEKPLAKPYRTYPLARFL